MMSFPHIAYLAVIAISVAFASHCPDKKCNFVDNEVPRGQLPPQVDVPWKLESRPDYTLGADVVAKMNKQINLEFQAFYTYTSMAYYFNRDDIGLGGFYEYFKKAASEEVSHGQQMMEYMNSRGAKIMLGAISPSCVNQGLLEDLKIQPTRNFADTCEGIRIRAKRADVATGTPNLSFCDWQDPLVALTMARELEIKVYKNLVAIHSEAMQDPSLTDFLEKFIIEGVASIKELNDLVSQLKRVEPCVGYYLIDKDLKSTK